MSKLDDIQAAQKNLEECFQKKMADLELQLNTAGSTTLVRLAEEFRTFKELMFSMLGLLRSQIKECITLIDGMETRHRRKVLVFSGIAEKDGEDCKSLVVDIIQTKMALKDVPSSSIKTCHRIGVMRKDHHRPILVRFSEVAIRSAIWSKKTSLKGSSCSVKEFLTRARQTIFGKARAHFGMRNCWSQDGIIVVKVSDGSRHKLVSEEEFAALVARFPKATNDDVSTGSGEQKTAEGVTKTKRNRKH